MKQFLGINHYLIMLHWVLSWSVIAAGSTKTHQMALFIDAVMYGKQMEMEMEVIGSELDGIAETLLSMDGMDKASCEAAGLALSKVIAKFKAFR